MTVLRPVIGARCLRYVVLLLPVAVLTACSADTDVGDKVAIPAGEPASAMSGPAPSGGDADSTARGSPDPQATPAITTTPQPPLFVDVTLSTGVGFDHQAFQPEIINLGAGVVVFDFNDDGLQDIFVSNARGPNALYRNNGQGTFTDVAAAAGVDDPFGRGNGGCAADYDNDGHRDLYVTNYGSSKFFRNNGDGTFADVTAAANVSDPDVTFRSTGCAWSDYDQDGFADLVVVRYLDEREMRILQKTGFIRAVRPLALYHNEGDGAFTSVAGLLGNAGDPGADEAIGNLWGAGFQPGWVDVDNDGDPDLYVVNDFGIRVRPNVLWRNDGLGADGSWAFTDISIGSGADVPIYGMGLAVGDYDLDGFFDLYMTNIGDNVLLKNDGDGLSFSNETEPADVGIGDIGLTPRLTWGTFFFDYDNDGLEDLYVVSGYMREDPTQLEPAGFNKEQPNVLLRNAGDGTFADVSAVSGADDPGIGRGAAYLDFNKDGCLDLFVANYGQRARLFRNVCNYGNNWLEISTVGATTNRDGIGARITVVSGGTSQIREVSAGSSQMSQNMSAAHFGLGTAVAAEYVLVRWPSGKVQTLTAVAANQWLTVTEPE